MQKKAVIKYSVLFIVMCLSGYLIYQENHAPSISGLTPDAEISSEETGGDQDMVGNDRDEHGCIGSAGYSWCEAKQKCLRPWEEECEEGLVYANKKYGFQITFEKGWEDYRVLEYGRGDSASFEIILPTTDSNWPGTLDADRESMLTGYASMFIVMRETIGKWTEFCAGCKKEPAPDCGYCDNYAAKTDKYVYTIFLPQDMPRDLLALRDATSEKVQKSFELLGK